MPSYLESSEIKTNAWNSNSKFTDTTEYFQYKGNTCHSPLIFALKWFHNIAPPQHLIYKQQMHKTLDSICIWKYLLHLYLRAMIQRTKRFIHPNRDIKIISARSVLYLHIFPNHLLAPLPRSLTSVSLSSMIFTSPKKMFWSLIRNGSG